MNANSDAAEVIDMMLDALAKGERPAFTINGKTFDDRSKYPLIGNALPDEPLQEGHKARLAPIGNKGKRQKTYREAGRYLGYLLAQPTAAEHKAGVEAFPRAMKPINDCLQEQVPYKNRGFSDRTVAALLDCGISDPERLLSMTKAQIAKIPGVGKVSLAEIMAYKEKFAR